MEHIVFYEPAHTPDKEQIWSVRGGYKYASIIGNLAERARVTLLMSKLPPAGDPHRRMLESRHGVHFERLDSPDIAHLDFAEPLAHDLQRALARLRATIVSNLNGRMVGYCYAAARAAAAQGIRYVMRVAGNDLEARGKVIESKGQPFWGTRRHFDLMCQERVAAHLADRIIVMTKRERERVGSLCARRDKIHVCFRGVDQSHFRPRAPAQQCRRFLFVGRRSLEKGYDILEEATARLHQAGVDVTTTFAGFEASAVDNRRYAGFVTYDGLPPLYAEHDALVVCSRSEGFPQVVMEAMSVGLPCILTRRIFEMDFEDEAEALLAEPDADAVADAMLRLHQDSAFYQRLARTSLETARQCYSEQDNQKKYHEVLLS